MSITKFQTVRVHSGSTERVDFGTYVINASVAVQGYDLSFGYEDHSVKRINVAAQMAGISGTSVSVSANCMMEDNSGNQANGSVEVLVIAVCES